MRYKLESLLVYVSMHILLIFIPMTEILIYCFDSTSRYHGCAIIPCRFLFLFKTNHCFLFDNPLTSFWHSSWWVYLIEFFCRGAAHCTISPLGLSHLDSVTKPSACGNGKQTFPCLFTN